MKKIYVLCVLILSSSVIFGQELKIVKFYKDIAMLDAEQFPKKDANGVNCGLIKLSLVIPEAEFEGDIISSKYSKGEWLIYMMNGANWINIKTPHYQPLRYDIDPPIESNVTYVMVVEIPPSDSTDYYLGQARRAIRQNDMEKLMRYVEKIPKEKVPDDLLEKYNNALSAKNQNDVINNLKRLTNNFTTIPDKETYNQCRAFIAKYPQSEYYTNVSNLLSTEGKRFLPGKSGDKQRSRVISASQTPITSAKNSKREKKESLISVGIGIEPFLFIPDDNESIEIGDCGIEANTVLRIGRPKNLVNGILGIGASTASYIEPNLHATTELRLNFGGDDGNLYIGLGADIALLSFDSSLENNKIEEIISSTSCFKIMVGYCKKKFEFNIGARIWNDSIANAAYIGLRWYIF